MNYFDIIDKLKEHFENDQLITTVSQGDIFDIDLNKQTIFPLLHIIVNTATFEENVIRYNISLLAMDIVDISKQETTDRFTGNDNELYVLNTMLAVLNRCYELLRRGTLYIDKFQVDGNPSCEPFTERMENNLSGWTMTVDILIPNDMTIC
tara:strand:+ start:13098 stop:13550 length:453 start_codon:yes stop_codon:yes gene_type:complete